jgi:hypothetical protein
MSEQAIPRDAVGAHEFSLGPLVAPRDAARVTLGRLHLGPAPIESMLPFVRRDALGRPAHLVAVRRHRSSIRSKLTFTPAYHLTTE